MTFGMSDLGYQAEFGIEQYVLRKALRDGKPVLGVETIGQQIGLFDDLPPNEQAAILEQTLQELDRTDDAMSAMVQAWRDGELDSLENDLLGEFDTFPELYENLVTKRNANWAALLEKYISDGQRYVMIVGALHLVGKDSVNELLLQRGYDVTPVTSSKSN